MLKLSDIEISDTRGVEERVIAALSHYPCVLISGPFEVGKSTLAERLCQRLGAEFLDAREYDGEGATGGMSQTIGDRSKAAFIIDNVQNATALLEQVRRRIDNESRSGASIARFILSGTPLRASRLVATLLGTRSTTVEITPVTLPELATDLAGRETTEAERSAPPPFLALMRPDRSETSLETLWLRGGFPKSLLSTSDEASFRWRKNFLRSACAHDDFYQGDGSATGQEAILTVLKRVAAVQGQTMSNGYTSEQRQCLSHLVTAGLVRKLQPWHANRASREMKPPKVYIRDTGMLHALLGITQLEDLRKESVALGSSWETLCIETLAAAAGDDSDYYFYRESEESEIDLLIFTPKSEIIAVEIKHGRSTKVSKDFQQMCEDIGANCGYVVRNVPESYGEPGRETLTLRDAVGRIRLQSLPAAD